MDQETTHKGPFGAFRECTLLITRNGTTLASLRINQQEITSCGNVDRLHIIFRFIESVGKLLYKHVQPHESMESFGISWVSMFSLGVLALSTRLSPEKVFCTVTYSVLLSQTPLPCLSHTKCFMACWLARSYRNMGNVRRLNKPEYTVYKWLMYYNSIIHISIQHTAVLRCTWRQGTPILRMDLETICKVPSPPGALRWVCLQQTHTPQKRL